MDKAFTEHVLHGKSKTYVRFLESLFIGSAIIVLNLLAPVPASPQEPASAVLVLINA